MTDSEAKFSTDRFALATETALFVEFPRVRPGHRFQCRLLGYKTGSSIIMTTPRDGQETIMLLDGDVCNVRYMDGQNVCAFESSVQHVCVHPFPYLHLYYPSEIGCVRLREAQRIPIRLDAVISPNEREIHCGTVIDLSEKGIGFITPVEVGKVGDVVRLSLALGEGADERKIELNAEICNSSDKHNDPGAAEARYRFGARFTELEPGSVLAINELLFQNIHSIRLG